MCGGGGRKGEKNNRLARARSRERERDSGCGSSLAQEAVLGQRGRSLVAAMTRAGVARIASVLVRAATGDGAGGGRVRTARGCV